jgi:hypothetical protein
MKRITLEHGNTGIKIIIVETFYKYEKFWEIKMDIVSLIKDLISKTVMIAWLLFFLSWIIGWAIKGAPIPMGRARKLGQSLIEDAVWGAFWIAVGTTIFWFITYISSYLGNALPSPPTPQVP